VETGAIPVLSQLARGSFIAWAGLLAMLAMVYLVARAATWLGMRVALRPWRRFSGNDWCEEARLIWPARRVGRLSRLILLITLLCTAGRFGWRAELLPPIATNFLIVVATMVGSIQAAIGWEQRFNPAMALTSRARRGAWIFSWSLYGPVIVFVFLLVGIGPNLGRTAALWLIPAVVLFLCAYFAWGWMIVMRWTGIIRPASDRLRAIVTGVAGRVGIQPAAIEQLALPMANAFALVRDRSIGMTDAALAVLDDDGIAAICAHELAHLAEPRWVRVTRLSFPFLLGFLFTIPPVLLLITANSSPPNILPLLLLAGAMVLVLIALMFYVRLVRRMEVRADEVGTRFEPTPGSYGAALGRLYSATRVPVVLGSKRRAHPELYDRLIAAGSPPEYPRPKAPPRMPYFAGMFVLLTVALLGSIPLRVAAQSAAGALLGAEAAAYVAIGATGGSFYEASALAKAAFERGDAPGAVELYRAAGELDASRAFAPAMVAGILAERHQCADAERFWNEAIVRANRRQPTRDGVDPDDLAFTWAAPRMVVGCRHDPSKLFPQSHTDEE
jgi:Zn-dependent protease with chaperone function